MPVGFSSAARNLWLLGASGQQVVTNFFKQMDASNASVINNTPSAIKYNESDEKYVTAGYNNVNSGPKVGYLEKVQEDGSKDWNIGISKTAATGFGDGVYLNNLHIDSSDNLIVCGYVNDEGPFISKYNNDGLLQWQSTSNSGDVEYKSVTSDSNNVYYACGHTESIAFVEKFDGAGTPGWGKAAYMLGRYVRLNNISTNGRGEVVAVGFLEDDTRDKGYIVKIDTTTGQVMWDRTLDYRDPGPGNLITGKERADVRISRCYIDGNDNIYITGQISSFLSRMFVAKYSPEGNLLWQKMTTQNIHTSDGFSEYPFGIYADTETEQIAVTYSSGSAENSFIYTAKYDKGGKLLWRRRLDKGTNQFDDNLTSPVGDGLDGSPSFYFLLFQDASDPDDYTFGKVSTAGNGLGNFEYNDGTGAPLINYVYITGDDDVGLLSDGSIRNDTSDFIRYPISPNHIVFDDLATPLANKKRQMDSADSFEYSGSPAIRPADFQELNLLGSTEVVVETTGGDGTTTLGAQTWSNDLTTANPADGFRTENPATLAFDGGITNSAATDSTSSGNQIVWSPSQFPAANGPYTLEVLANGAGSNGGWGQRLLKVNGTTYFDPAVDSLPTDYITVSNLTEITEVIVERQSGTNGRSRLDVIKVNGTHLTDGQGITLSASATTTAKVKDQSGKGNDCNLTVAEQFKEPHPGFGSVKFDGVDDYLSMPDSQLLEILDADFTIECWIYVTGTRTEQCIFSKGRNVQCYWNDARTISLYLDSDNSSATGTSGYGVFFSANLTGTNSVLKDQWNHIAICRDNNTWKAFVNGTQKYSNVIPGLDPVYNSSDDFEIGSYVNNRGQGSLANEFEGWISNFRFLKGTALYSANFTVPTTPLTSTGSDTSLLTCQGDTIVDARTGTPNVITANGGVLPSRDRYSPEINAAGYWEFDGTDDKIVGPPCNTILSADSSIELWVNFDDVTTRQTIISGYMNDPDRWDFEISGGNFQGGFHDNGYFTSSTAISIGSWNHVMLVLNSSTNTLKFYLNGVEDLSQSCSGQNFGGPTTELGIGDRNISSIGLIDGKIGEIRIYKDRSLTAAQVFQNYNATKSKYINEAPDTAPKIGPGIVTDSNLILNYDFGNRATYNPAENLLPDTIDLKNDWTSGPNGPIETSDVASPTGTYDVFKVTTSATDQNAIVYEAIDTLTTQVFDYTFSFWVKSVDGSSGTWGVNYFANGHNRTTVPITGEWTRVSFTFTAGTGGENIYIGDNRSDLASINEAYVWGPQLNKGGVMEPYVRTYGSAITAPTKVKNLSSTSFPGTINGATFNPAGYFEFDGTNDYIQSSSVMAPGSADFSVVFWYKITGTGGRGGLFERPDSSPYSGWVLGQGGTNNWSASVRDASNNNVAFQYTFPTVDQWTCDAFTWDVSTQTLTPYRNGANAGTATNSGTVGSLDGNTRYPMAIGGRLDSGSPQYKPMECGEVQMYSRVLTAAEVSQNFNATKGKYGL